MRLSTILGKAENKAIGLWQKYKEKLPHLLLLGLTVLYTYGFLIRLFSWKISLDPITNIRAVFTPTGLGLLCLAAIFFLVFTKKGFSLLSGDKTVQDKKRGIEILAEGTHGTSGFMSEKERRDILLKGELSELTQPLFGKAEKGGYIAMKDLPGMSKNVMIYGAPGTGKSRGFVLPFALQAARRGESLVMIDPKAEFYEMLSGYFKEQGYYIRTYNLLDLASSDGWNCMVDISEDLNLVQNVAEIIIRNTSNETERADFWSKAEKNLLMALLHYVRTMTVPGTDRLFPQEERSLGTIYKLLSTASMDELDARFRALPSDHPALPPYGIFRQAHKQIWGNIMIGLGNRLNVFQNKLVDEITRHNEIDLTLPGRKKCAYFCIISDQDSSLEFLSSMFFSLLTVRLFDFARAQPTRRLPVCVNLLLDEYCNISLLDSKKIFSVSRSRNINIQAVVQSIAQLSNRYPKNEWQELVGDCDYQLFLGCNDTMTAEYISKQCGEVTVRVNNALMPQGRFPFFLTNPRRPFTRNKSSTGRPLLMPDEVRRLQRDQAILLVRGAKPLRLYKITPEEIPAFHECTPCKATDYVPEWRKKNEETKRTNPKEERPVYQVQIPLETEPEEYIPKPVPILDISKQIDCRTLTEADPKEL